GDRIREALQGLEGIDAAFIYGSYAQGTADAKSDLDLMIVGNVKLESLSSSLSKLEAAFGRPVNLINYTLAEWRSRLANREPFAMDVRQGPKLMLIGSEDAL
ncbi:MAG: nucleotidyltransferase domain-containing protein, partial [Anaerolineales bacterium]